MSKIGRQQVSKKLLADIVEIVKTTSFVTLSDTEPEDTAEGSFWLQTGAGIFEPTSNLDNSDDVEVVVEKELIVANARISDDAPSDFNPVNEIWFDIQE